MERPAILGGKKAFEKILPMVRPYLPHYNSIEPGVKEMFASHMISNDKYVKKFEDTAKNYFNSKYCVAVSSCTSGLMLTEKALNLSGEVILPSFTFFATGHSLLWNNLKPVFVDVDPDTYQIDPAEVEKAITNKTTAILGVHLYGCPCPAQELEIIARDHNLKLLFDAAHAFGAKIENRYVGTFGDAEIFSCSPTKLMVTGEGGIVSTPHEELARKIKIGRNYGDDGSYDCEILGLNSRMPEFSALLGIETIRMVEENIKRRTHLYEIARSRLSRIPGIIFQKIPPNVRVTHKDTSLFIRKEEFGLDRDQLKLALEMENVMTKKYFYPPLHKQKLYSVFAPDSTKLKHTDRIASNVLSIPLFSGMTDEDMIRLGETIARIHEFSSEINASLR